MHFGMHSGKILNMTKVKWNIVRGMMIAAVFIVLLAMRLGVFDDSPKQSVRDLTAPATRPAETWMNIYQDRQKIGFVHRRFRQFENGYYQNEETVSMRIKTMGISQALHMTTETDLKPDRTLSAFRFELNSGLFRFTAQGFAGKDSIIIYSGLPHARTKTVLPVKDIPHLSGNIYEAAFHEGMAVNHSRRLSIFDPSTLSARKITVERSPDEVIALMGRQTPARKFCADFMGAQHCAWLSEEGEILKETGLFGLSMEKVSPEKAKEGMATDPAADWVQIASVSSNVVIDSPSRLTRITLRVEGIGPVILERGRQTFRQNILTVTREDVLNTADAKGVSDEDKHKFLSRSPLVQSDHPEIIAQAGQIVSPSDSPHDATQKIVAWVYKNIAKKPVLSIPSALEVLRHKEGDCNEHAVLTAALLRAAGIPAQIETGLVYLDGRFYYHAWNRAFTNGWVTADSVFNQMPADVTHIRLAAGEGGGELDLLGVMGKIKLEVLTTSYD